MEWITVVVVVECNARRRREQLCNSAPGAGGQPVVLAGMENKKHRACCALQPVRLRPGAMTDEKIWRRESVVVCEYESVAGERVAHVEAWGDASDMEDQASAYRMVIVRAGWNLVFQRAIKVVDLLHGGEE